MYNFNLFFNKHPFIRKITDKDLNIFWSSNRYLAGKNWDNFGDAIVPLLVKKMSNINVIWTPKNGKLKDSNHKTNVYFVIGSILEQAGSNNIIWGAGIMNSNSILKKAKYLAVRGPISYSRVIASGHKMKMIWGDPALLCPFYFPIPKKCNTGKIILAPHYVDYENVVKKYKDNLDVEILDLKSDNIELLIEKLATAKLVYSSSLHGLIVAQAYGVRAVWVMFSDLLNGDEIKFNDYFMSVGIRLYKPYKLDNEIKNFPYNREISLPDLNILQKVQLDLLESCPFIKKQ